jgi:outer membrane protein TolC
LLLQQVQINLAEEQLKLQNAKLQLSIHLWVEGYVPLEISDSLQPEPISTLATYWDTPNGAEFLESHPTINLLQLERESYNIDLQLYRAALFPKVKLSYQMLAGLEPFETSFEQGNNGLMNNHYLGVGVSLPLFWASERANLKQSQLKIRDTDLKIAMKRAELDIKFKQLSNEANTYTSQINLFSNNIDGFRALVEAEETLFAQGESSLFLVNARINSLLNAQLKFADLNFKRKKAIIYWYVVSGQGF